MRSRSYQLPSDTSLRPQSRSAEPSWARVIGTTFRLWLRRKVLRIPDSGKIGRRRAAWLAAAVIVVVAAISAVAVALAGLAGQSAQGGRSHAGAGSALTRAQKAARAAKAAHAAANANATAAAAWMAAQISAQTMVDCDPAMCADLQAAGFPAGQVTVLQQGGGLPAGGISATVVASTAALRAEDSSLLAASAPALLASFGTGAEVVEVRLLVPGGAARYQASMRQALAAQRRAGRAVIRNGRVHLLDGTRRALAAGQVDRRLSVVLDRLARLGSIYVVQFASAESQAGPLGPYRQAQVDGLMATARRHHMSELAAALKLVRSLPAAYRAQVTVGSVAGGRAAVTIWFPAPSPF
jgi:hypothetical protein